MLTRDQAKPARQAARAGKSLIIRGFVPQASVPRRGSRSGNVENRLVRQPAPLRRHAKANHGPAILQPVLAKIYTMLDLVLA